jgi:hypothetical protein
MSISNSIRERIQGIDRFLAMTESIGFSLGGLSEDLVKSISDDGAVPYIIGTQSRYRTTPLASVLFYMNKVGLLPENAVHAMQDKLFFLRDEMIIVDTEKDDVHAKKIDDSEGWSIDEGVSVWTTSMAIMALLSSDFIERGDSARNSKIKSSILWLIDQQYDEGYWAFQKYESCKASVPMTSLALRALTLARESKLTFGKTNGEETKLNRAISGGVKWLKRTVIQTDDQKAYWLFDGNPSTVATAWAVEAIYEEDKRDRSENKILYQRSISYILNAIPQVITKDNIDSWDGMNIFVNENNTKYKGEREKQFYSFLPACLPVLMKMGYVDSMNPKIVTIIKHLTGDYKNWIISGYDGNKPCTFSIAMALFTIVSWFEHIENGTYNRVITSIFGINSSKCIICPFITAEEHGKRNNKKLDNETRKKKIKRRVTLKSVINTAGAVSSFITLLLWLSPLIINTIVPAISGYAQRGFGVLISLIGAVGAGILSNIIFSKIQNKKGAK